MPTLPPRAERPRLERDVVAEIRAMVASSHASVLTWRNNVGSLQDARGRWVQYGLAEGSADLIACAPTLLSCPSCGGKLPALGRFVGLEVKTESGRVRPEQVRWAGLVNAAGGVCGVARSAEDAAKLVARARFEW